MTSILSIHDLHASVEGKEILRGISLEVPAGQVHAIMGPNGSGKSTLANTLMGHPKYEVTAGTISFDGKDLLALTPDERAKAGVFLSFQYPQEIPGVSIGNLLRQSLNAQRESPLDIPKFFDLLTAKAKAMGVDEKLLQRGVNEGFSGGEKKRMEILQMSVLEPKLAILDETDSGLDIDALKIVADGVNRMRDGRRSFLVITHYQRLLKYIQPDVVHVLVQGKMVKSGGPEVARELEDSGYENLS